MIERSGPAQAPGAPRENEPLEGRAARPPLVPKDAQILARAGFEPRQVRRIEKSADAEENGFDLVRLGAQSLTRKPLREESEGELVLFVAKRCGEFLEERLIVPCNSLSRCNRSVLRCNRNCAAASRMLRIFSSGKPRSGA